MGTHWVEQFYKAEDGAGVVEVITQWEGDTLCVPPLPVWQCYDPNRKDKEGKLIPKYRERLRRVITRGHIICWNDNDLYNRVSISTRTVEVERLATFLEAQPEVFDV